MKDRSIGTRQTSSLLHDISFEMTVKDIDILEVAGVDFPLASRISITALPGDPPGSRVSAAIAIKRNGLEPVPHISARRLTSTGELSDFLYQLHEEVAVESVFVVAGDLHQPLGPFYDALSIIETGLLKQVGIRTVGIAGYPDGHPDISIDRLDHAMAQKIAALDHAGHDIEIVTQFTFDPESVLAWLVRLRNRGIIAPVRVGIPGPANVKTLLKFAARCGVGASTKVLGKYGLSLAKLLNIAGPDRLVDELSNAIDPSCHGEVRLHFYPFGGLAATAAWTRSYLGR